MNLQQPSLCRSITDVVEKFKIRKGFFICNILSNRLLNDKNGRGLIYKLSVERLCSKPCRSLIIIRTVNV